MKLELENFLMPRRRLTKQQTKRIDDKTHHDSLKGLLISRFGTQADVQDDSGRIIRCKFRQNLGNIVAGDRVLWQAIDSQHGVILSRENRTSTFGRPDKKGQIKAVAANIDKIFIVVATKPALTLSLLDSYLVAIETLNIPACILLNKSDLPHDKLANELKTYESLGYEVIATSTQDKKSINHLLQILANQTSVFVGQSGVGKSSLINLLLPEENIGTGEISVGTELGKHTTSMSRLYHLPNEGSIIDSPGIREFGLWHMPITQIEAGFIEFKDYLSQCKFRDCKHKNEPGCAIIQAVSEGLIKLSRYNNYLKLV